MRKGIGPNGLGAAKSPLKQTRIGRRGPKAEGAGALIGQAGSGRRGQGSAAAGIGSAVGQITQPRTEVRRIPHAMTELPAKKPSVPTPEGANNLKPVAKPEAKSKKQTRKEKRADKLEAKANKLRG
jgi:hypothetical protein